MENYESLIEQIRKVKALADEGVGGEKENAQIILTKLLKKYKISLDDLIEDDKLEYKFRFNTDQEKKILFQCLSKYSNAKSYSKPKTKVIAIQLTKLQYLDVVDSTKFYTKLFKTENDLFLTAFIHKHNLYGDKEETDNDEENNKKEKKLSDEEIKQLLSMMESMKNASFISNKKRIG